MFRSYVLRTVLLLPALCLSQHMYAGSAKNDAYRDFWYPLYHGMRLSYCSEDHKECGLDLASKYCRLMGYEKAFEARIDHNVGLTRYAGTTHQCKGWRCDGFVFISCEESLTKEEPPIYSYRSYDFVRPRFHNYRVNWCYKKDQGCGSRAANAFCRHQGYRRATVYEKQENLAATQTVADQELCFGKGCDGFSHITCYR